MPVTAKDVARAAGVSQATVSYVVNDSPHQRISPQTRARVLAAVEELGYTPSAAARALRRGTSDVVLVVLPDVPIGPTISHMLERLADELEPLGLTAVWRRARATSPLAALWRELRPVAAVGVAAFSLDDEAQMRAAGIHVVSALLTPQADRGAVAVPQEAVGRLQVEHLAARGHVRLGYAAPGDARVGAFTRLRLAGARAACADLGLDEPVVLPVRLDAADAEGAVLTWRGLPDPVTAVCAYNDETAFALLAGLRGAGLRAPEDLAVMGVDDIPLAALASPPLTTVDQNIDAYAAFLARDVAHALRGVPAPAPLGEEILRVVVRESA